jgi:hypothetical protein
MLKVETRMMAGEQLEVKREELMMEVAREVKGKEKVKEETRTEVDLMEMKKQVMDLEAMKWEEGKEEWMMEL